MNKIFTTRDDMFSYFEKNLIIAELGVFRGDFSKIIFNKSKPQKLYLVDLFSGYFGSGDKDGKNHINLHLEEEYIKLKDFFKDDDNVIIIKSSTVDFLNSIENDYLDIIYVDADHSYESVKNDLIMSYQKIKTGGFICGHDYIKNTEVELAVNEFCRIYGLNIEYLTLDGCPSFCIIKK